MKNGVKNNVKRLYSSLNTMYYNLKTKNSSRYQSKGKDLESFSEVYKVWKPPGGPNVILLRWYMTEWCNYKCPYCSQTHGRFEPKGDNLKAHSFDNFPIDRWLEAFRLHFKNVKLSLVITGGEPLIDKKNMVKLLTAFNEMPEIECVRIDTNASWNVDWYKGLDKSKIILMCTYHPSQIEEHQFFDAIQKILDNGFHIGMINFVITSETREKYFEYKNTFKKMGVPLHPNPIWDKSGHHKKEDMQFFENELPTVDYLYRTGTKSPKGKKCLFPSLAYEMDFKGNIHIGCYPKTSVNFLNSKLPLPFPGPVTCPNTQCACLDKYSFLEGINRNVTTNPLELYSQALLERK